MTSTFQQCEAYKPDGQQCVNKTREDSKYCHIHEKFAEDEAMAPLPLAEGTVKLVSLTSWSKCEYCGEMYPLLALKTDDRGKLSCKSCIFRGAVYYATSELEKPICLSKIEVLARAYGITVNEALVELLEDGFKSKKDDNGHLIFWRPEPKVCQCCGASNS